MDLKYFRERSSDPTNDEPNILTQRELVKIYNYLTGEDLAEATYHYHERGIRNNRPVTPAIDYMQNYIAVFLLCGGLDTLEEANQLLRSYSYRGLFPDEVKAINAQVQNCVTRILELNIVRQFLISQNPAQSRSSLLDAPIGQVLGAINASQSVLIRSLFPTGKTTILEQLVSNFENKRDNTVIYYLTRNRWEYESSTYSSYHLWNELLALYRVNHGDLNEQIDRALAAVRKNEDYFLIRTLFEEVHTKRKTRIVVLIDNFDLLISLNEMAAAERFPGNLRTMYTSHDKYLSLILTMTESTDEVTERVPSLGWGSTFFNGMQTLSFSTSSNSPDLAFSFAYVKSHLKSHYPDITDFQASEIAIWSGGMPRIFDEMLKYPLSDENLSSVADQIYRSPEIKNYLEQWWNRLDYLEQKVAKSVYLVFAALSDDKPQLPSVSTQRTITNTLETMFEYGLITSDDKVGKGSLITSTGARHGERSVWRCTSLMLARWVREQIIERADSLDYEEWMGIMPQDHWLSREDWNRLFNH